MIEMIDFNDFDKNGDDETPSFRPVRHSFIPGYSVRNGKVVLFDNATEPCWIDALTERFHESGNQFELFFLATSLRVALDYDSDDLDNFFFALLQDLLNTDIDRKAATSEKDYRKKVIIEEGEMITVRLPALTPKEQYPSLSLVAKGDTKKFRQFQRLVNANKFGNLGIA